MSNSFSSRKEHILKLNNQNEIEMKQNLVQEIQEKSHPVDSTPIYNQAIMENDFSPRLVEADAQILMEEGKLIY